jgi:hypothetical protein
LHWIFGVVQCWVAIVATERIPDGALLQRAASQGAVRHL